MSTPFCPQQWSEDAKAGRLAHIEALLRDNHRMLEILAARYAEIFGAEIQDLYQEGSLGLVSAYDSFDPQQGVMFSSWSMRLAAQRMISFGKNRVPLIGPKSRSTTDWHSRRFTVISLNTIVWGLDGPEPLEEIIPSEIDGQDSVLTACDSAALRCALLSLPARHQRILQDRYWSELTLAKIARRDGSLRQTVTYHERKAMRALGRALKRRTTTPFNSSKA